MKKAILLIPLCSLFVLIGCTQQQPSSESCSLTSTWSCATKLPTVDHSNLSGAITDVLLALKNGDMQTLSSYVWTPWVRFSPYAYIHTGTDVVLSAQEIASWLTISKLYLWGAYDGSGKPINLSIWQYFKAFVSDADYGKAPNISYNQISQRGNSLNNIVEAYQWKQWAEFYFSGFDAQYWGMDRKWLTLVFENISGQRYLIGIIHGSWTI